MALHRNLRQNSYTLLTYFNLFHGDTQLNLNDLKHQRSQQFLKIRKADVTSPEQRLAIEILFEQSKALEASRRSTRPSGAPAARGAKALGVSWCGGLVRSRTIEKDNQKITSLRVIPTVTSYWNIFVTNSDILCAKIWRGREEEDNSDEI